MDVGRTAITYYEQGRDDELLTLAAEHWPEAAGSMTPAIAEMCFFARTVSVRADDWAGVGLWGARAMVATVLSRSERTAVRLLLADFFRLSAQGHHAAARAVLHEMGKLVELSDPAEPMVRLYHEKLAYSFLADGRPDEAAAHYRQALGAVGDDRRGRLKVRGGLAIALRLTGADDELPDGAVAEFRAIADEARAGGFPDVVAMAESNAEWARGRAPNWTAFELL